MAIVSWHESVNRQINVLASSNFSVVAIGVPITLAKLAFACCVLET